MITKWDIRFLELAKHISTWSKDPSTKVGAVIVRDKKIIGVGYNGFPANIADDDRYHDRDKKYGMIIHAEMNAILNSGESVDGCTVYTYPLPPCNDCAKIIIQAGIKKIVTPEIDENHRWCSKWKISEEMFMEAGIDILMVKFE